MLCSSVYHSLFYDSWTIKSYQGKFLAEQYPKLSICLKAPAALLKKYDRQLVNSDAHSIIGFASKCINYY